MTPLTRVAILGDRRTDFDPHVYTDLALGHAADHLGAAISVDWVGTELLAGSATEMLHDFEAYVISPGSPYRHLEGLLEGVEFARKSHRPVIGTCAGFQHMVLEFARNELGFADAYHQEYGADEGTAWFVPLSCSVAGQTLPVDIMRPSIAYRAYGHSPALERYYCQFGIAPQFWDAVDQGGLSITGRDADQEPRIVELQNHDFYVATLFVPQAQSRHGRPHPLITAFLAAALSESDPSGRSHLITPANSKHVRA